MVGGTVAYTLQKVIWSAVVGTLESARGARSVVVIGHGVELFHGRIGRL